ncbi:MAG: hypothetical protein V4642_06425 [Bacteroidota bacterium]
MQKNCHSGLSGIFTCCTNVFCHKTIVYRQFAFMLYRSPMKKIPDKPE